MGHYLSLDYVLMSGRRAGDTFSARQLTHLILGRRQNRRTHAGQQASLTGMTDTAHESVHCNPVSIQTVFPPSILQPVLTSFEPMTIIVAPRRQKRITGRRPKSNMTA